MPRLMARHTPGIEKTVKRSIPSHFRTAYPRRQEDCPDPERGLASVEAIFLQYYLLEGDTTGLQLKYHWVTSF